MALQCVLAVGIPLFVTYASLYWVLPNILALIFTLLTVLLSNSMVLGAARLPKHDLHVIESFNPDIVIIQLDSKLNKRNSSTRWLSNRQFCQAPARCLSCPGHLRLPGYHAPAPVSF